MNLIYVCFYNSPVDFLGVSFVNCMVLQCQRLDLPTRYSTKSAGFSHPLPDRWQLRRRFYPVLHFWKTLTALRVYMFLSPRVRLTAPSDLLRIVSNDSTISKA